MFFSLEVSTVKQSTRIIALALLAFSAACSKADKGGVTAPPVDTTHTPPPPPPPPPPGPVDTSFSLLVAAGNIARCQVGNPTLTSNGNADKTAKLIDSLPTATVLTLGNAANPAGSSANYGGCYNATWGRFFSRTYAAAGSHDYDSAGLVDAADFFSYFGSRTGPTAKGWFSFNTGAWHVVVLNTENKISQANFYSSTSEQQTWLEADLAGNTAKCTIVAFARPRFYSSSTAGGSERTTLTSLWNKFQSHNVDVVLNGGAYQYERFAPMNAAGAADPAGIRQFIAGMGGESANTAPTGVRANSEKLLSAFGFLKLKLRATSYDFEYVGQDGAVLDSGTGTCH